MIHEIKFTPEALEMLLEIKKASRRDLDAVMKVIESLKDEPNKRGKALVAELTGMRSIRAAGQRYRIVYEVNNDLVQVLVIGAGIRRAGSPRDIYNRLK